MWLTPAPLLQPERLLQRRLLHGLPHGTLCRWRLPGGGAVVGAAAGADSEIGFVAVAAVGAAVANGTAQSYLSIWCDLYSVVRFSLLQVDPPLVGDLGSGGIHSFIHS